MCLATVYIDKDGQEEEVMRDVAWIMPEGGALQFIGLMGERRLLQAKIKRIDLLNGLVVLETMTTDPPQMMPGNEKS